MAQKKKPKKPRRVSPSPDHPHSRSGPIASLPERGRKPVPGSCRISLVAGTGTREPGKPASRKGVIGGVDGGSARKYPERE